MCTCMSEHMSRGCCSRCVISKFSQVVFNTWAAQFESESCVPRATFWRRFWCPGVDYLSIFRNFGVPEGARAPGIHGRKRVKKERKRGPKWRSFWHLCPGFGYSEAHLEAPEGKKNGPKAPEGDFVDIVKTYSFLLFLFVLKLRATRWGSKSSPGAQF